MLNEMMFMSLLAGIFPGVICLFISFIKNETRTAIIISARDMSAKEKKY